MAINRKKEEKNIVADNKYVIQSKTELEEAQWLIEQGLFKDMNDYIHRSAQAEINYIKYEEAQRKKQTATSKNKLLPHQKK